MEILRGIVTNKPLVCAAACWLVAQIIKVILELVVDKAFDKRRIWEPGGMPSSHTAFVTGLAVMMGMQYGYGSAYFALAAAYAIIVMYDACGVRRAVGNQAKALNTVIAAINEMNAEKAQAAVHEILGHTPLQVLMGAILGIIMAVIFANVWGV